jgi:hypothetical protein
VFFFLRSRAPIVFVRHGLMYVKKRNSRFHMKGLKIEIII